MSFHVNNNEHIFTTYLSLYRRLSGELAKRAKHVTTTDFIESFVEENKKINGPKFNNMTFRTVDAMKLDYPQNTFDMVFSVWLFMYLSDEEVESFLHNVLKYVFLEISSSVVPIYNAIDARTVFLISLYGAPLAQRASYLPQYSFLFEPDGAVNYDYIITNSINSLLIGSRCIPNGAHINYC